MINDDLLTRVFENIIYNGVLKRVNSDLLTFSINNTSVDIQMVNESEHHDKTVNVPLSVERITMCGSPLWNWEVIMNKPIKKGVLFIYYINTPHNQYIIKPTLSKQEEYRDRIQYLLEKYEFDYVTKLLGNEA